jgi:lysosomal acid lipase/cholesteryl ester hydrolase
MIARAGYKSRSYVVETEDGYLLTVNRIFSKTPGEHHPVLLQHGLVASSADWLMLGPGKALGITILKKIYFK